MWTGIFTGLSLLFILFMVFLVKFMNKVIQQPNDADDKNMQK